MTDIPQPDTSSQITILRSRLKLCKRFINGEGQAYPNAKHFDVYTRELSGINDLHDLLTKLNDWPLGFVIRGQLIGDERRGVLRRMKGDGATFRDPLNGRQWTCIDVDSVAYWGNPESPESVRRCIATALPKSFSAAACVFQWSASAGVDGWSTFKLHLWYWLDRPVCGGALVDWLHTYPVDPSLFRTIQPHYTAAPIFEGCEDPVKGPRVGMLTGSDCVEIPWTVPSPAEWREKQVELEKEAGLLRTRARKAYMRSGTVRVKNRRQAVARGILKRAGKAIVDSGEGERHGSIYSESAGVGNFVGSGLVDHNVAVEALLEAAKATLPGNRHREAERVIRDAIRDGMKTPRSIKGV